jgi:uncharacterized protein (UPF0276 family)
MTGSLTERIPNRAGVGLRLPHLAEIMATRPSAAWFEVHPENFLSNPHATELLVRLAHDSPISVHTVGVSIGSASGIDRDHLRRVRVLIDLLDPFLVSGHLAWSTHQGEFLNDLLPLPYDDETLDLLACHVDQVQEGLARPYLVENPASYFGFGASIMNETEFLSALVRRTGCGLLCDVSNVHVSAHNMGFDPYAYIDGLPADAVAELHLGGFTPEEDEATPGGVLLVDTHASVVAESVWDLYAHAVGRFGRRPTLIEWDNDLPVFACLLNEAARADAVVAGAPAPEDRRAAVAC